MDLLCRDVPMSPIRCGCNQAAKLGAGLQRQTDFYRITIRAKAGGLDIDDEWSPDFSHVAVPVCDVRTMSQRGSGALRLIRCWMHSITGFGSCRREVSHENAPLRMGTVKRHGFLGSAVYRYVISCFRRMRAMNRRYRSHAHSGAATSACPS